MTGSTPPPVIFHRHRPPIRPLASHPAFVRRTAHHPPSHPTIAEPAHPARRPAPVSRQPLPPARPACIPRPSPLASFNPASGTRLRQARRTPPLTPRFPAVPPPVFRNRHENIPNVSSVTNRNKNSALAGNTAPWRYTLLNHQTPASTGTCRYGRFFYTPVPRKPAGTPNRHNRTPPQRQHFHPATRTPGPRQNTRPANEPRSPTKMYQMYRL